MTEMRVGTRELKNKLSEYLRRVKAGETITVTEHGRPIGQIIPASATLEDKMAAMVASGQVEWNGSRLQPYRAKVRIVGNRQLSDLVVEDRE